MTKSLSRLTKDIKCSDHADLYTYGYEPHTPRWYGLPNMNSVFDIVEVAFCDTCNLHRKQYFDPTKGYDIESKPHYEEFYVPY